MSSGEQVINVKASDLTKISSDGGTQKLAISSSLAQGSAQPCHSCLIHCPDGNSGDVHLTFANEDADVDDWLVPKGQAIPTPIDDVSDLHFYGTNDSDLIYVIWRK